MVQMVKQLLRKVLGRASLSYSELVTVLVDCESVINSRPLTYVSEDSEDLIPLTPSMFLMDIGKAGVPDFDLVDSKCLSKRAKYRQNLRAALRSRFRKEYLGQLIHRVKMKKSNPIQVGDIVLIGQDNVKRMDWQLGRVEKLIPGKDQHVRVAKVKTSNGILVRPVQRLYHIEVPGKELEELGVVAKNDVNKTVLSDEYKTRFGLKVKVPEPFSAR